MSSSSPLDSKHVENKLQSLINSRESIQTLSMWALSHKAQHEQIVSIWFQVLKTAKIELRLCLFYLCNDIVQTCRREHAVVFKDAFKEVLKDAALLVRDASVRSNVKRIFKIWLERKVYDEAFVKELLATLYNTKVKSSLSSKLLEGFHPENLKRSIIEMVRIEEQVELKQAKLSDHIWSREEVDAHKHEMKNKSQGQEIVGEMKKTRSEHLSYVTSLAKEQSQRKELILTLELSELFYDAQLGECNILNAAFRTYGNKLNQVKRTLSEMIHPEEKEMERQKKEKRKKSKSVGEEGSLAISIVDKDPANGAHRVGSNAEAATKSSLMNLLSPPPPPPDVWATVASTTNEVQSHQFQVARQSGLDESNFYQQKQQPVNHRDVQQQMICMDVQQKQQQFHASSTGLQQKLPYAPMISKTSNIEDSYEMNHYEIGGEECTPVYDEDALGSGDATPVQDEDPSDGYISSKDNNRSTYSRSDSSKDIPSSQPGIFMGVNPITSSNSTPIGTPSNSHINYPLACLPQALDVSRPPPPFNLFFSPTLPGMIRSGTTAGDKDKSLADASQSKGVLPQVMSMPPRMFSVVGMSSSIASPTRFGMIPYSRTQQQLTQTPSNFSNLLPAMGQASLMTQLSGVPPGGVPFQQQIISSPHMMSTLGTLQQQQHIQTFSPIQPDNHNSLQFSVKTSPSLSSSSIPTLQRSTSSEPHHQMSMITKKDHDNSNHPRGLTSFKDGDSMDNKRTRKARINQSNLAHVKATDNLSTSSYAGKS